MWHCKQSSVDPKLIDQHQNEDLNQPHRWWMLLLEIAPPLVAFHIYHCVWELLFFFGGAGLMRKPNRPETCVAMHILLLKVPLFSQLYMLYVRICRIYTYIYIINKQSTWRNKMIGYMKMAIWVAWCDMDGVCNPHSWNCCDRIAENVRIWSSWY